MSAITTTPVVGLPQQGGWSQVYNSDSLPLVFVFSVSGSNAGNVGRDLLDILDDVEPRSAASLHQTMELLVRETEQKDCRLSVVAGLFGQGHSILGAYQATALLKRDEKVGRLLQAQNQVAILEGKVVEDDIFVLSTRQAEQFLGEIQQKFNRGFDVDTIVTSVVPGLHSMSDSSQAALLFVTSNSQVEDSTPERVSILDEVRPEPTQNVTSTTTPPEGILPEQTPALPSDMVDEKTAVLETIEPPVTIEVPPNPNVASSAADPAIPVAPVTWQNKTTDQVSKVASRLRTFRNRGRGMIPRVVSLGKVGAQFLTQIFGQITNKEVYVNQKSRRGLVRWLVVALLLVLVVAGGTWALFSRRNQRLSAAEQLVAPIEERVAAARGQESSDPIAARETVAAAIQELDSLLANESLDSISRDRLEKSRAVAQAYYDQISGEEELPSLSQFYDLRTAQENFISTSVAASQEDNTAYFLDAQQKRVIILNLANKQQQVVAFDSAENLKKVGISPANILVLADRIWWVDDDLTNSPSTAKEGDQLAQASQLATFGNNVYIYNPDQRMIFRLAESDGELADPQAWIRTSPAIDLERVSSLVVDGDIWLSDNSGQIARMRSGRPEAFEVNGLSNPFNSELFLVTTESSPNLYVLESDQKRIVILEKETGNFLRQVTSSSLAATDQIFLNSDETTLFSVSGSTVYEIPLDQES